MGNVNDKNASGDEEKDTRHVLLNPKGHFDPWTVCMHFALCNVAMLTDDVDIRIKPKHEQLKQ